VASSDRARDSLCPPRHQHARLAPRARLGRAGRHVRQACTARSRLLAQLVKASRSQDPAGAVARDGYVDLLAAIEASRRRRGRSSWQATAPGRWEAPPSPASSPATPSSCAPRVVAAPLRGRYRNPRLTPEGGGRRIGKPERPAVEGGRDPALHSPPAVPATW